jgi:hypothetical protein
VRAKSGHESTRKGTKEDQNKDLLVERILGAMGRLRCGMAESEYEIHQAIMQVLVRERIQFRHEYKLGKRCRIDFICGDAAANSEWDGVGIEVKKGKVGSTEIARQVERYGQWPAVRAIVLVIERNVYAAPERTSGGKPVYYVSLSKNWGIALN